MEAAKVLSIRERPVWGWAAVKDDERWWHRSLRRLKTKRPLTPGRFRYYRAKMPMV